MEATVRTESGAIGRAATPSGASKGAREAVELLDGGQRLMGRGVRNVVANVNGDMARALNGMDAADQRAIDEKLCALDGTDDFSRLGANAVLAVSLACARAGAACRGLQLFEHIAPRTPERLPLPMMNVLNGGAHASNNVDIQEFMVVPVGARDVTEGVFMCVEVYQRLREILKRRGLSVAVGDEGGFAPDLGADIEALELLDTAARGAGVVPGRDVAFAMDIAASGWLTGDGRYFLPKRGETLTRERLMERIAGACRDFPVISVEDPLHEEDFEGFARMRGMLEDVMVVGDDLFVTSAGRVRRGIEAGSADALLVKPNQAGTLTRALEAAEEARRAGMELIVSHRSGETECAAIADIAAALGAGYLKAGAPARGERTVKYNRLMEIGEIMSGNIRAGAHKFP